MPKKGCFKYPVINGLKKCSKCLIDKPVETDFRIKKSGIVLTWCRDCYNADNRLKRSSEKGKRRLREYRRKYVSRPGVRERLKRHQRKYRVTAAGRFTINNYRKSKALKTKSLCIQYKGGQCQGCGYKKCFAALDFHHVKPFCEIKKTVHGANARWPHWWGFDRRKKHLDKCVLLCSNCHRELHAGERDCPPLICNKKIKDTSHPKRNMWPHTMIRQRRSRHHEKILEQESTSQQIHATISRFLGKNVFHMIKPPLIIKGKENPVQKIEFRKVILMSIAGDHAMVKRNGFSPYVAYIRDISLTEK